MWQELIIALGGVVLVVQHWGDSGPRARVFVTKYVETFVRMFGGNEVAEGQAIFDPTSVRGSR